MAAKQPLILRVRQQTAERIESIMAAAASLRGGSLVVVPTDTVYGVAADARLPGAVEQIYAAKSRERGKPIPILAAGMVEIEAFGADFCSLERRLATSFWPGPLTLVLKAGQGTEGFRVPDHDVALELLREVGGVLRVTSANVSGESPALTAEEAVAALGGSVDMVLDAGRAPGGVPSTVARVENGKIVILREGAISLEALSDCC
jgi:L-threonylcarbamoyladenylate synthase